MITAQQFREMLERLLEKSRANRVNWRKGGDATDSSGRFAVDVAPGISLLVSFMSPSSSPDFATATLVVNYAIAIEISGEDTGIGGDSDFKLLRALYLDAQRSYYGWDDALQKLNEALQSEGPIGIPEPPSADVPF